MRNINLDREWIFDHGTRNTFMPGIPETAKTVNLPHDYMIESDTFPEAPAGAASGYYTAGVAHYRKSVMIPAEWEGGQVILRMDGVMMNATVEVNSSKAALQHYGYAPFTVDITPFIYFGEMNSIVITVNPSMQPNSRWYSGAGIFRSMELIHRPMLHIAADGIFVRTDDIEYDEDGKPVCAYMSADVDVENLGSDHAIAEVKICLVPDQEGAEPVIANSLRVQVDPHSSTTARMTLTLDNPALWSAEEPNLYRACASAAHAGEFRTHFLPAKEEEITVDTDSVLFGIRTVRADVRHGLRINGKAVKLKGGCLHHDNGPLGAVSLYDAEYRKLSVLKSIGFNAVRTTHNPPSSALIEACDRLGLYVFDEAFDAWSMGKQPGDYNQFFETDWQKDLTAFVRRDRSHPCVVIWSTGNEITERGGLGNGYSLAQRLAAAVKALDPSRPVSNAICSFWNGLDDVMAEESRKRWFAAVTGGDIQNADIGGKKDTLWEEYTESFTNGLDIVGYNYMEDKYPYDHERFPERIILGSENYPCEIGMRWPMVEETPWVIGDFTWTAVDYIGEAGIGKSAFFAPDDPILKKGKFALASHSSNYPWRLANDADVDICGNILPQGLYRSVVWGSDKTFVLSYDPDDFGKTETITSWGFTGAVNSWNWTGKEGRPVNIAVFSGADEVALFVGGKEAGRQKAGEALVLNMPKTFLFPAVYEPGTVEAVSYRDGREISRGRLASTGAPAAIRLVPEKTSAPADGHSLIYVKVEVTDAQGAVVPDAAIPLRASLEGSGLSLAAFGSGNPITAENYTSGSFSSYRGLALAILRTGYEAGEAVLTVSAEGLAPVSVDLSSVNRD